MSRTLKFIAVELKQGEKEIQALASFYKHASGIGLQFYTVEPFGLIEVGSTVLLRFQTDCETPEALVPFFQEEQRAFVYPGGKGYKMSTQTTEGTVTVTTMQSSRLPGYNRRWRGTIDKFWKRQFPATLGL